MRVLIIFSNNSSGSGFLVHLHTDKLVREIKKYISKRDNSRAMVTAITKGRIEQEIAREDAHRVDAELILNEDRVCWDLTK
jgi:methylmalonyl-CoA mutase N-terminal domain/subunit